MKHIFFFILLYSIQIFAMASVADSDEIEITFRLNCINAKVAVELARTWSNSLAIFDGPNNCILLGGKEEKVHAIKNKLIQLDKSQR